MNDYFGLSALGASPVPEEELNVLGTQPTGGSPIDPVALAGLGVGQPQVTSTTGRLMGGTPAQYTGPTPPPRVTPGTQIIPQGQPPAVSGSTQVVSPSTTSTLLGQSATPQKTSNYNYKVNKSPSNVGTSSPFSKFTSGLLKGIFGAPSLVLQPNEMGDSSLSGANQRAMLAGEPLPFPEYDPFGFNAIYAETKASGGLGAFMEAREQPKEITYTSELEDLFARNNRGELTPEQYESERDRIIDAAQEGTKNIRSNIAQNQIDLAKQIQEHGKVTPEQQEVQEFLNERAKVTGELPTDVITPFKDQAQLTADLFTSPETAIGQFVPRATFTLPDGTIIQEDEGGNRRQITADQLRQFEQDMASMNQPSVVGLGIGGDRGVVKSFDRQMGEEAPRAALEERFGAPTISQIQALPAGQGVGTAVDPQGRMVTSGVNRSAYEQASAEREARLAARPDLTEAQPVASRRQAQETGVPTDSELRRIAKGQAPGASPSDAADAAKILARLGYDPVTGERPEVPTEIEQQTAQASLDLLNKRIEEYGKKDPTRYEQAKAEAADMGLTGDAYTTYIYGRMGVPVDDGDTPITTGGESPAPTFTEAQESIIKKVMDSNPNSSREEVIKALQDANRL